MAQAPLAEVNENIKVTYRSLSRQRRHRWASDWKVWKGQLLMQGFVII